MRLGRSNSFRRALSRRRVEEPSLPEGHVLLAGQIAKLAAGKWQKTYAVVHHALLLFHKDQKV